MGIAEQIRDKLTRALNPQRLDIVDQSHRHAGHVGASPAGETHFDLVIVAAAFEGRSRVERHRMVYRILAEELAGPVHALSIEARTPDA